MRHAKDLSTKSAQDIAAIFGAAPKSATIKGKEEIPAVSSDSSVDAKKKDKKKKKKRKLNDECSKKESKKKKKSKK